ncbi:cytochrome P450, partial [Auriscalpium vulgare]
MPLFTWIVVDLLVLATAIFLTLLFLDHRKRRGVPYPPGPPSLPIIGNLLDVSSKEGIWMTYHRLGRPYGALYSLRVLGQRIVVVQSRRVMTDLFERRGSKYSARIVPAMLKMAGYDAWFLSAMQPNSPSWRTGRRSLDRKLGLKALIQYQPTMEQKAREFVKRLLLEPDDFVKHIQLLAGGSMIAIAYGQDVQNEDDELLQSARAASNTVSVSLLPGGLLVNDLPFLRHIPAWVPYLSYGPIARDAYNAGHIDRYRPWNTVKDELVNGTAQPSVAREELLEHQPFDPGDEFNIAGAIGTMFAGGADTIISVHRTFFLMLALYPDVQTRAQAEIDAVIGRERLPSFSDRASLPYIEAMCKE